MRHRRRIIKIACLVVALMVLPLEAARACSCVQGDPRDSFDASDGAFVGTFVEKHLAEPDPTGGFNSGADTIYTFVLDEEYKGELGEPGDTVEVHSPFSGASCGLEVGQGRQYGLFLQVRDTDQVWTSNLCSQVSPETMRQAASPLPAPRGEGSLRMLVGGSFGKAQVMGLDRRGRTLGYGFGGMTVTHIDVCPGRSRALEIAPNYPGAPHLFVRDLNDYDKVRELRLPFGRGERFPRLDAAGLHCRGRSGRRAVVFATNYGEPTARGVILKLKGREITPVYDGTARAAVFSAGKAFVQQGRWGRVLASVSLRSGATRVLTTLPGAHPGSLVLGPDGDALAGVSYPDWEDFETKPTRFFTVDVSGGRSTVRSRSLGTGETEVFPEWVSSRRPAAFVAYPRRSFLFDRRLQTVSRFPRWDMRAPAIVGDKAFGVTWDGKLRKLRVPDGPIRTVRELPSPLAVTLRSLSR